jgi:hypothetical protein
MITMTRRDLERRLLAELRKAPDCEAATNVTVHPLEDGGWSISNFNAGTSDRDVCTDTLGEIEERLHGQIRLADG